MNDKEVLLIGADMRKPRLHHIFNITMEEGLSTYLIGQSKYEDIIAETGVKNLYLVSSGPVPPNPAELLERDQYRELITQDRQGGEEGCQAEPEGPAQVHKRDV